MVCVAGAENGCGAGINHPLGGNRFCRFKNIQSTDDVYECSRYGIGFTRWHLQTREMNYAASSRFFESRTHGAYVGNVAGDEVDAFDIVWLHDRIEPPRVLAAIKNDGRVATLSKCFDNPGADAALRPRDEIGFCHTSRLASYRALSNREKRKRATI